MICRLFAIINICCLAWLSAADAIGEGVLSRWSMAYQSVDRGGLVVFLQDEETGKRINIINGMDVQVVADGLQCGSRSGNARFVPGDDNRVFSPGIYERRLRAERVNQQKMKMSLSIKASRSIKYAEHAFINSGLIAGGRFFLDGSPADDPIEVNAKERVSDRFKVGFQDKETPSFNAIAFETSIGVISIEFIRRKRIVDFRKVHWSPARCHIISAHPDEELSAGQEMIDSMTVSIAPNAAGMRSYTEKSKKWFGVTDDMATFEDAVSPTPKWMKKEDAHLIVDDGMPWDFDVENAFIAEWFFKKINDFGIGSAEAIRKPSVEAGWRFIRCGSIDSKRAKESLMKSESEHGGSDEMHFVDVTRSGAIIISRSDRGVWAGIQTFLQMAYRQWSGDRGIKIQAASILDWPDYKERRCMLRIGGNADFDLLRQVINQALLWKFNSFLIEFQFGISIDELPELAFPRGGARPIISGADVKSLIGEIRSLPIAVTPMWNAGKLLEGISHRHVVEKPRLKAIVLENPEFNGGGIARYYDISISEAFSFNRDVCDVLLDWCGANKICIGLDEIYDFPRYTRAHRGRGDISLSNYINAFTDYYSRKGIKVSIAHDMLCARSDFPGVDYFPANAVGNSEKALGLLRNRDCLQIDYWDYSEKQSYPAIGYFMKSGIETIGMTWFRDENIRGMAKYGMLNGLSGITAGTYCFMTADPNRAWQLIGSFREPQNFPTYAFLPALHYSAEYFWTASDHQVRYHTWRDVLRLYDRRTGTRPSTESQFPLHSVSEAANVVATEGAEDVKLNQIFPLAAHPSGDVWMSGIRFAVPRKFGVAAGASACSLLFPGLPLEISVAAPSRPFRSLFFLHSAICRRSIAANAKIGASYRVHYNDGTSADVALSLDENIMVSSPPLRRFNSGASDLWCAWVGETERNEFPYATYVYEWKNPFPQKTIEGISLIGNKAGEAVLLFGITGIQ